MEDPRKHLPPEHPLQSLWPYFNRQERKAWRKARYDVDRFVKMRGGRVAYNIAYAAFAKERQRMAEAAREATLAKRRLKLEEAKASTEEE